MAVQLGHFIYENAGTGCLLSKYCNHGLEAPLTESATRIQEDPAFPEDPFCGVFISTWIESIQNVSTKSARLVITRKRHRNVPLPDLYILEWQDLENVKTRYYIGEAMLYKNMLVGAYK